MTLEQLDVIRGWAIAVLILSLVVAGYTLRVPSRTARRFRIIAQIVGGCAGLALFYILSFFAGWDEYFAAKAMELQTSEYIGTHRGAAEVIELLGSLEANSLGIVFGVVGLGLLIAAVLNICAIAQLRAQ